MGLFTPKPVAWRRTIKTHADTRGEFNQLVNTIGRPATKKFLETMYDKHVVVGNNKIDTLGTPVIAYLLKKERENYVNRQHYVDSLVPQSASGALGAILRGNLRATADYYKSPLGGALAGRDLAIDQAANWICGSYSAALPATRALLQHYIPARAGADGPMGKCLGTTPQHIRAVFAGAVQNPAAYRINLSGTAKYCSTIGGSVGLEHIFGITGGTTSWPAFGAQAWESIAMFYMIAIIHVQAFPDGNKRTGHYAYAIALIKGTHTFSVPVVAKESELFKMNG